MLTRRDFRWIAIGLVAFCLYDYWDISQHKVPQNTVTFVPDPRFRGVLNLFVESGPPLMKIQIDLDAGQGVSHPNNGKNPDPALPVQCGRDPQGDRRDLPSPNGAFFISCEFTNGITVKRADGSLVDSHVFVPGSEIGSEAWAPDSSAVAVLTKKTKTDFYTPRGILRLFSGHPIELTTYRVFLLSPQNDHVKEIPVLTRPLEGAWAAVGWVKSRLSKSRVLTKFTGEHGQRAELGENPVFRAPQYQLTIWICALALGWRGAIVPSLGGWHIVGIANAPYEETCAALPPQGDL